MDILLNMRNKKEYNLKDNLKMGKERELVLIIMIMEILVIKDILLII